MNLLEVKNIRVRAQHGCLPQEKQSPGDFNVDLKFWGNFNAAMENDDLSAAIDYVDVTELVLEEMSIPSKLIEHAAKRIADRCLEEFAQCERLEVSLTKHRPPVNHLGEVNIRIERSR